MTRAVVFLPELVQSWTRLDQRSRISSSGEVRWFHKHGTWQHPNWSYLLALNLGLHLAGTNERSSSHGWLPNGQCTENRLGGGGEIQGEPPPPQPARVDANGTWVPPSLLWTPIHSVQHPKKFNSHAAFNNYSSTNGPDNKLNLTFLYRSKVYTHLIYSQKPQRCGSDYSNN